MASAPDKGKGKKAAKRPQLGSDEESDEPDNGWNTEDGESTDSDLANVSESRVRSGYDYPQHDDEAPYFKARRENIERNRAMLQAVEEDLRRDVTNLAQTMQEDLAPGPSRKGRKGTEKVEPTTGNPPVQRQTRSKAAVASSTEEMSIAPAPEERNVGSPKEPDNEAVKSHHEPDSGAIEPHDAPVPLAPAEVPSIGHSENRDGPNLTEVVTTTPVCPFTPIRSFSLC